MMVTKVSVVVLTYNPQKDKLIRTLESILQQRDIDFQIVLADDGSKEKYYDVAKKLFEKYEFLNYKLVQNVVNKGTVKNCLSAVEVCNGEYIKLISPGDYFCNTDDLKNWVEFLTEKKAEWSFCDAFYYRFNCEGEAEILEVEAHPQNVKPYLKNNFKQCRWNYVILDDICLGAATICKNHIIREYLELISGKVFYAEDNIYRLMMAEGLKGIYYPKALIMYEIGDGVSTSQNDIWNKKLKRDWDVTSQMILERCEQDKKICKALKKIMSLEKIENKYLRKISSYLIPGYFLRNLKRRLKVRITSIYYAK